MKEVADGTTSTDEDPGIVIILISIIFTAIIHRVYSSIFTSLYKSINLPKLLAVLVYSFIFLFFDCVSIYKIQNPIYALFCLIISAISLFDAVFKGKHLGPISNIATHLLEVITNCMEFCFLFSGQIFPPIVAIAVSQENEKCGEERTPFVQKISILTLCLISLYNIGEFCHGKIVKNCKGEETHEPLSYTNSSNVHDHRYKRNNVDFEEDTYGPVRYSNPYNNHDHLKVEHSSRKSAVAEIKRMKRNGYRGSDRLVEYYNRERNGWYVGNER